MFRTRQLDHPGRLIWWLLGLLTLLRLLYAWWFPLDLSGDETYYWDWGRQPDWGYLSKPPLIAWIMTLLQAAGGDSAVGMRLLSALISVAVPALVYGLGREMYGARIGLWAALLMAMTPANAVLGLALTPDAPLILCWCGALWAFWRWHRSGGNGAAAALVMLLGGGLLAKQTLLAFYPLALLFLASCHETRRLLARPSTWLLGAASLLWLLPMLWWNAGHGWATLSHSAHHFMPTPLSLGQSAKNLGELFGAQILLAGPVTWGLLALVVPTGLWRLRQLDRGGRYLALMGGLPLLLGALLALRQEVQANWLLPFYPAAILGLVAWGLHPDREPRLLPWLRRAAWSGALFMAVTCSLPFLPLEQGLAGRELDPLHGLKGWRSAAREVQEMRERTPDWRRRPLLVYGHRYFASELAFYLPDRPRIYRWPWLPGRIESQYELWGLPPAPAMDDVLIVSAEHKRPAGLPSALQESFRHIQPAGALDQIIGRGRSRHYRLYLASGWRGVSPAPGGGHQGQ